MVVLVTQPTVRLQLAQLALALRSIGVNCRLASKFRPRQTKLANISLALAACGVTECAGRLAAAEGHRSRHQRGGRKKASTGWFFIADATGLVQGPVPLEKLRGWVARGLIKETTFCGPKKSSLQPAFEYDDEPPPLSWL